MHMRIVVPSPSSMTTEKATVHRSPQNSSVESQREEHRRALHWEAQVSSKKVQAKNLRESVGKDNLWQKKSV